MTHDQTQHPVAPDASVDLGQAGCGDLTPLIRGRSRELQSGQVLEVFSEEPAATEGVPAWCRLTGNELIGVTSETARSRFLIRKK
jgi:5-methyltetrahydropteroyltriglutamate--homocysteine methyltransferase